MTKTENSDKMKIQYSSVVEFKSFDNTTEIISTQNSLEHSSIENKKEDAYRLDTTNEEITNSKQRHSNIHDPINSSTIGITNNKTDSIINLNEQPFEDEAKLIYATRNVSKDGMDSENVEEKVVSKNNEEFEQITDRTDHRNVISEKITEGLILIQHLNDLPKKEQVWNKIKQLKKDKEGKCKTFDESMSKSEEIIKKQKREYRTCRTKSADLTEPKPLVFVDETLKFKDQDNERRLRLHLKRSTEFKKRYINDPEFRKDVLNYHKMIKEERLLKDKTKIQTSELKSQRVKFGMKRQITKRKNKTGQNNEIKNKKGKSEDQRTENSEKLGLSNTETAEECNSEIRKKPEEQKMETCMSKFYLKSPKKNDNRAINHLNDFFYCEPESSKNLGFTNKSNKSLDLLDNDDERLAVQGLLQLSKNLSERKLH